MTRRMPAVLAAMLVATSLFGRPEAATITDSSPIDAPHLDARIKRFPGMGSNQAEVVSDSRGFWAPTAPTGAPVLPQGSSRAQAATAALPGWQFLGPEGGSVKAMAISPTNPSVVLAGTESGLWRSVDGGISWSHSDVVPAVKAMTFAPDGKVYVASAIGLYRGTADGTLWEPIGPPSPYPNNYVTTYSVALNPTDPNEIWVGVDLTSVSISLMRSRDGGATWQNVTPSGAGRLPASGITFNSSNPSKVYACFGVYGGGVWFSPDGGATWSIRSTGLPRNPMHDIVYDGTRVLVCGGREFSIQVVGLYASSNDGITWTPLHATWPTRVVMDIELDAVHPATILAATDRGVFRSLDSGVTWEFGIGGTSASAINVVKRVPHSSTVLSGAENDGVSRSIDDGDHFARSTTGMHAVNVVSIAANPIDPREYAVGIEGFNTGALYTSHDAGVTWLPEPVPPTRWGALTFTRDGTLYAASHGPSTVGKEGVYRRNADGSWTRLTPDRGPLYETDVLSIRVSSSDPQLMFASGDDWVTDQAAIWRSADGGATWSTVHVAGWGAVQSIDISENGTDLVVLGIYNTWVQQPGYVARSLDRGLTWQTITDGLAGMTSPWRIAHSPLDPRLFYVASLSSPGLFRSTDAGLHWTSKPTAGLAEVACDASDPRVVYVAGNNIPRVGRSEDGGDTFAPLDDGLGEAYPVTLVSTMSNCPELLIGSIFGSYRRSLARPDLTIAADSHILWPPNHELANLHMVVEVHDACDAGAGFVLTSITSNEPMGAQDIVGAELGTPDVDFQVRAERDGSGSGRVYTVTYTATNAQGNTRSVSVDVVVPHDASGGPLANHGESNAVTTAPTAFAGIEPNPFHLDTGVSFSLARRQPVSAEVYDARGVLIRRLASAEMDAGRHRLTWDGRTRSGSKAPVGIYLVRLATADGQWTRTAALIR